MESKFDNGSLHDIAEKGSLMYLLYSGLSPMSETEWYKLKENGTCMVLENGVIAFDFIHVFDKCNNETCIICKTYKGYLDFTQTEGGKKLTGMAATLVLEDAK